MSKLLYSSFFFSHKFIGPNCSDHARATTAAATPTIPAKLESPAFIAAFAVEAPAAALDVPVEEPDPEPEPVPDEAVGVPTDTVLFEPDEPPELPPELPPVVTFWFCTNG